MAKLDKAIKFYNKQPQIVRKAEELFDALVAEKGVEYAHKFEEGVFADSEFDVGRISSPEPLKEAYANWKSLRTRIRYNGQYVLKHYLQNDKTDPGFEGDRDLFAKKPEPSPVPPVKIIVADSESDTSDKKKTEDKTVSFSHESLPQEGTLTSEQLSPDNAFLQSTTGQMSSDSDALKQDDGILLSDNDALRQDNEQLVSDNDALRQDNEQLVSDNDALRQEIKRLSSDNDTLRQGSEKLLSANIVLERTNGQLTSDNDTLRQVNEKLSSENAALQRTNGQLTSDNDTLRRENEKFSSENAALQHTNGQLASDNDTLRQDNGKLTSENDALRQDNGKLIADNDARKREIEKMSSCLDEYRKLLPLEMFQIISETDDMTISKRMIPVFYSFLVVVLHDPIDGEGFIGRFVFFDQELYSVLKDDERLLTKTREKIQSYLNTKLQTHTVRWDLVEEPFDDKRHVTDDLTGGFVSYVISALITGSSAKRAKVKTCN